MNYRNIILIALITLGLNGCVGVNPNGGYDITVPLSMVNTTVQGNFPQTKDTKYGKLMIEKPNILSATDSDKLGVGTGFKFSNRLLGAITGAISLSSGIRYDATTKGVYLNSPMVDEIKFEKFALSNYLTPSMRNQIGQIIAQTLVKKPIYNLGSQVGASFVKGLSVKNGSLVVNLGL